jgi:hypothetical protein
MLIKLSLHQHAFPLSDADDGSRAGVEFQKIFLDPVAENDAVLGN